MRNRIVSAVRRDEHGQTMAEYAVVLAVITAAVVTIFTVVLPDSIQNAITSVIQQF